MKNTTEKFLHVVDSKEAAELILSWTKDTINIWVSSIYRLLNDNAVIKVKRKQWSLLVYLTNGEYEEHYVLIKDVNNKFWYHAVAGLYISQVNYIGDSFCSEEINYISSRIRNFN